MGSVFVNDGVAWKQGIPYVHTGFGWVPAQTIYVHDGFEYKPRYNRNTTQPQAPDIRVSLVTGERRTVRVIVRTPSTGNIKRVVLKAGLTWPSNPTDSTGYYPDRDANGIVWSEVLSDPGSEVSRQLPATYQTFTLPYSTTIYFSAWTLSNDLVWSTASTAQITTLSPTQSVQSGRLNTFSAYIYPDSSGSWSTTGNYWNTANTVSQNSSYGWTGLWFYGDKLRDLLRNAVNVTAMRVYAQRIPGSEGDTSATTQLVAHSFATQPGGSPQGGLTTPIAGASLLKGEAKWVDVPTQFWSLFQGSFDRRGIGVSAPASAPSASSLSMYGQGTESGKLYVEWQQ